MRLPWRGPRHTELVLGAALIVMVLGGLLRLDAVHQIYGPVERPAWADLASRHLAPLGASLRPTSVRYARAATPYVGSDPINYLADARAMRHLYQAHVREPLFLAWTKLWLWLLDDQDIGISYASAAASTLAILATYLLGAAAVSPAAGLIAATVLAFEMTAVIWSAEGWRDDTYMLLVTLTAWQLVRLLQAPTRAGAVATGLVGGLMCLTRLSAVVLLVPALAWLAVTGTREGRAARVQVAGIAAAVAAALILPYLIACARATGDPFYAVNYHTAYYDHRDDGARTSTSATAFLGQKLRKRPVATFDTALEGLAVWPLRIKFDGLAPWNAGAPHLALVLSVAGLALAFWCAEGRLLLVILVASLAPYVVTWSISGGGAWRFSAHAYPLYLVGAAAVVVRLGRLAAAPLEVRRVWSPRAAAGVLALAAAGAAGWAVQRQLPWWVAREAIAAGEAGMIVSGERDAQFFRGDWSAPHRDGNVSVRAALARMVDVRLPFAAPIDHDLTLRMDPPERPGTPVVAVFLNGRHLGDAPLVATPGRVGTYRFRIPATSVGRDNRLRLIVPTLVPAREAGQRFAFLAPDQPVGFRLWYVRIQAIEP